MIKKFGQIIGTRPQQFERYKKYHSNVWPKVMGKIMNISGYSVQRNPEHTVQCNPGYSVQFF
jgi:L-rhamnose mutarotase